MSILGDGFRLDYHLKKREGEITLMYCSVLTACHNIDSNNANSTGKLGRFLVEPGHLEQAETFRIC